VCLGCRAVLDRGRLQDELLALNPEVARRLDALAEETRTAPDGDAEVDRTEDFRYPACPRCGGMLKPEVVFFGENADRGVVERAWAMLEDAAVLLVLGSSLSVMSGLRFVRRAAQHGRDVVIANDGATRGDDLATLRIHGRLEDVLTRWAELLT